MARKDSKSCASSTNVNERAIEQKTKEDVAKFSDEEQKPSGTDQQSAESDDGATDVDNAEKKSSRFAHAAQDPAAPSELTDINVRSEKQVHDTPTKIVTDSSVLNVPVEVINSFEGIKQTVAISSKIQTFDHVLIKALQAARAKSYNLGTYKGVMKLFQSKLKKYVRQSSYDFRSLFGSRTLSQSEMTKLQQLQILLGREEANQLYPVDPIRMTWNVSQVAADQAHLSANYGTSSSIDFLDDFIRRDMDLPLAKNISFCATVKACRVVDYLLNGEHPNQWYTLRRTGDGTGLFNGTGVIQIHQHFSDIIGALMSYDISFVGNDHVFKSLPSTWDKSKDFVWRRTFIEDDALLKEWTKRINDQYQRYSSRIVFRNGVFEQLKRGVSVSEAEDASGAFDDVVNYYAVVILKYCLTAVQDQSEIILVVNPFMVNVLTGFLSVIGSADSLFNQEQKDEEYASLCSLSDNLMLHGSIITKLYKTAESCYATKRLQTLEAQPNTGRDEIRNLVYPIRTNAALQALVFVKQERSDDAWNTGTEGRDATSLLINEIFMEDRYGTLVTKDSISSNSNNHAAGALDGSINSKYIFTAYNAMCELGIHSANLTQRIMFTGIRDDAARYLNLVRKKMLAGLTTQKMPSDADIIASFASLGQLWSAFFALSRVVKDANITALTTPEYNMVSNLRRSNAALFFLPNFSSATSLSAQLLLLQHTPAIETRKDFITLYNKNASTLGLEELVRVPLDSVFPYATAIDRRINRLIDSAVYTERGTDRYGSMQASDVARQDDDAINQFIFRVGQVPVVIEAIIRDLRQGSFESTVKAIRFVESYSFRDKVQKGLIDANEPEYRYHPIDQLALQIYKALTTDKRLMNEIVNGEGTFFEVGAQDMAYSARREILSLFSGGSLLMSIWYGLHYAFTAQLLDEFSWLLSAYSSLQTDKSDFINANLIADYKTSWSAPVLLEQAKKFIVDKLIPCTGVGFNGVLCADDRHVGDPFSDVFQQIPPSLRKLLHIDKTSTIGLEPKFESILSLFTDSRVHSVIFNNSWSSLDLAFDRAYSYYSSLGLTDYNKVYMTCTLSAASRCYDRLLLKLDELAGVGSELEKVTISYSPYLKFNDLARTKVTAEIVNASTQISLTERQANLTIDKVFSTAKVYQGRGFVNESTTPATESWIRRAVLKKQGLYQDLFARAAELSDTNRWLRPEAANIYKTLLAVTVSNAVYSLNSASPTVLVPISANHLQVADALIAIGLSPDAALSVHEALLIRNRLLECNEVLETLRMDTIFSIDVTTVVPPAQVDDARSQSENADYVYDEQALRLEDIISFTSHVNTQRDLVLRYDGDNSLINARTLILSAPATRVAFLDEYGHSILSKVADVNASMFIQINYTGYSSTAIPISLRNQVLEKIEEQLL